MKISVVIPVYNREKCLLKTLDSVWKQTHRPIELILVDNASTDSSYLICKEFQQRNSSDDFKVMVCQELKRGANAARNKGLGFVTGEYVSFYDSDDEMFPQRLERIAQMITTTDADIIGTISLIREKGGNCHIRNNIYSSSIEDQILVGMLSTQNFIVKTALIRSIRGWNEELHRWQDWEVGIRLLLATSNIKWIKTVPLDCVYWHESSITGTNFSDSYDDLIKAVDTAIKAVKESNYIKKDNALLCLLYRKVWLAGLFYREKSYDKNKDCLRMLNHDVQIPFLVKWLYKFLYQYIKYGGRGAWRIVRFLIR